jgi:broad specificity phosphatase PhoE
MPVISSKTRFYILSCLFVGLLGFSIHGYAQTLPSDETLIFLVRHAEKDLTESTSDPNLSAVGKEQAQKLAALLKDAGIQAIYSTATKRTEQTAQPLLQQLGLSIQHYDAKETKLMETLLKGNTGKRILVVSHSNIVPNLLNDLTQSKKYTYSEDYGDLFVIRVVPKKPASVVHLHF